MVDGSAEHLYNRIDRDNVVALNSADGKEGKVVIKSWEQRNDETEVRSWARVCATAGGEAELTWLA